MSKTLLLAVVLLLPAVLLGQVASPDQALPSPISLRATAADPVDLFTGLYIRNNTDLTLRDVLPLRLDRAYRNADPKVRAFGVGTNTTLDTFIVGDGQKFSWVALVNAEGSQVHFTRTSPGTGFTDAVFRSDCYWCADYADATIHWIGNWEVDFKDGRKWIVSACSPRTTHPSQCGVLQVSNRAGQSIHIEREPNGDLKKVTSPNGKWISFVHDPAGAITLASDSSGRSVHYRYDSKERLIGVSPSEGRPSAYRYNDRDEMIEAHEPYLDIFNEYSGGRCTAQTDYEPPHLNRKAWKGRFTFRYHLDANWANTATDSIDSDGTRSTTRFDPSGIPYAEIFWPGKPEQVSFELQIDKQHVATSVAVSCLHNGKPVHLTRALKPPFVNWDFLGPIADLAKTFCDRPAGIRPNPVPSPH